MKPIVISVRRQKTEIAILLDCFLIANGLNAYAIIKYKTPWSELIQFIGYVFVAACALYVLTVALRLLLHGLLRFFRRGTPASR